MPIFDWFRKPPSDPILEALITQLEVADFFEYADPQRRPRLKEEMRAHAYPFPFGLGRQFFADAEDLAEGGVARFLDEIGAFLTQMRNKYPEKSVILTDW